MRPVDTERLSAPARILSLDNNRVLVRADDRVALSLPCFGTPLSAVGDSSFQPEGPLACPPSALRLAVVQSAVSLTDGVLSRLTGNRGLLFVLSPDKLLCQLNLSAEAYDIIA